MTVEYIKCYMLRVVFPGALEQLTSAKSERNILGRNCGLQKIRLLKNLKMYYCIYLINHSFLLDTSWSAGSTPLQPRLHMWAHLGLFLLQLPVRSSAGKETQVSLHLLHPVLPWLLGSGQRKARHREELLLSWQLCEWFRWRSGRISLLFFLFGFCLLLISSRFPSFYTIAFHFLCVCSSCLPVLPLLPLSLCVSAMLIRRELEKGMEAHWSPNTHTHTDLLVTQRDGNI